MTREEIRKALDEPSKASRKALAKVALELETDDPERYKAILAKKDWEGEALLAYRRYRWAFIFSRLAMVIACVVVIGSYLVSDFGMGLISGGLQRYALAIGVSIGMGIFAGGTLWLNAKKDRLIVLAILEDI